MDQNPRPVKRMSDIGGPRRPLDLRAAARPETAAPVAPATRPLASRPVAAPVRPTAAPLPEASRPAPAQPAQPVRQEAPAKTGGAWKTVLQFIIGVIIILLVAFSIVVLYVKYYAG